MFGVASTFEELLSCFIRRQVAGSYPPLARACSSHASQSRVSSVLAKRGGGPRTLAPEIAQRSKTETVQPGDLGRKAYRHVRKTSTNPSGDPVNATTHPQSVVGDG